MIIVLKSALQTTVQDLGRRGHRHLGVPQGGAMDPLALTIGNYLLGNAANCAALELCMPPAQLRFEVPCAIALTGAECFARLDDVPLELGRRVEVEAGQILLLGAPSKGFRAYLCVAGGIEVPAVMGSRSTDLQASIGGLEGRLVRRGDALQIARSIRRREARPAALLPALGNSIRVMPGREFGEFDAESRGRFLTAAWRIGNQSNRMGYRLEGTALVRSRGEELKSHAVFPGFIQVPPGGAPIVLMADAQATGGYPRIATVIAADLWRLAQIRPGASVRFTAVGGAEALHLLRRQRRYLQRIRRSFDAD